MELAAGTPFAESSQPRNWYYMASVLHKAAAKVDWRPNPQEITNWRWVPLYRMLMGFAIENLIKGILIAEGNVQVFQNGRLAKGFATHRLKKNAALITGIEFTEIEKRLLDDLEPYVRWAGRYPIPQQASDLIEIGHSVSRHDLEQALGQRLADYLNRLAPEAIVYREFTDEPDDLH
jgi:hypothetical protein